MIFSTHIAVPDLVIHKIGLEIKERLMHELEKDERFEYLHSDTKMYDLGQKINFVLNQYVEESSPSYNGWVLEASVAREISGILASGRKIEGIKEFRRATGAGLKEAKDLIDEFGTGREAAERFILAFT
jgi:hypothetical protein